MPIMPPIDRGCSSPRKTCVIITCTLTRQPKHCCSGTILKIDGRTAFREHPRSRRDIRLLRRTSFACSRLRDWILFRVHPATKVNLETLWYQSWYHEPRVRLSLQLETRLGVEMLLERFWILKISVCGQNDLLIFMQNTNFHCRN